MAQRSARGQQLAALQQDNAQLRSMYKHLESKLALLSLEPAREKSELAPAMPAMQQQCPDAGGVSTCCTLVRGLIVPAFLFV